jgi:hypothetical protein
MRGKGVGFLLGRAHHLGDLLVLPKYTETSPRPLRVELRMMMLRWAGKVCSRENCEDYLRVTFEEELWSK